jgi:site-specific recombinase XerD
MTPIAPHITAFLRERLTEEHTRAAYAYAFQLLFTFASRRLGAAPSDLQVEHLDAPLVLAFLDHIQHERGNAARTRNTRLAAIRSFMRFLEHRVPAALDQIRRVRAIPVQRTDTRLVPHLSAADSRAVLDAPDPTSRLGIRDRAMIYLALTGGLRVSELVGLRLDAVRFDGRYVEIRVCGKGRKERALLLWKEVGDAIRAWLAIRGTAACPEVFLTATTHPMTRAGFAYVLRKHVRVAAAACPSLTGRRVSPHTLRHTCALNTLQATGDIRKVSLWLGHAHQSTTEIYLQADPTEKIAALESSVPLRLRPGRFRPSDRLIASLRPGKTPPPPAPG